MRRPSPVCSATRRADSLRVRGGVPPVLPAVRSARAQTLVTVHGYEVDALFRRDGVVEMDGWEFHRGRVAFGDDRERDAELLGAGYETVRITWERLQETAEREAARLMRILARREREIGARSVELAASDRQARLTPRPRRVHG